MSILGGVEKIHNNLNTYTTEDIKVFKFSTNEWGAIINDDDYSVLQPIRDWRALGKTPIIEMPAGVFGMSGGRSISFIYLHLIAVAQGSEETMLSFEAVGENAAVAALMECRGTNVIDFNIHTAEFPVISGNTVDGELLTIDGAELKTSGISVSDLEDVISSIDDVNTKTFYLSSTNDLTNAQAAYDWYLAGKNPIIRISGWDYSFILEGNNSEPTYHLGFYGVNGGANDGTSNSSIGINPRLELRYSSNTVTSVVVLGDNAHVLFTDVNYSTPYTPAYPGSPATKKYVDDSVSAKDWIEVNVATAAGTVAKVGTTTAGNYNPTKGDFLLVNFVDGCSADNPTLNIDGSGAKNIRTGSANANKTTFSLGAIANSNIKALLYYDGTYYRCWSTTNSNTTYSAMSVSEGQTGTATNGRLMRADYLEQIIKYHAVSDTAYDSTWDGVTDIAPSKNAVYDKIESLSSSIPSSSATAPSNPVEGQLWYDTANDVLKVYDGTNWNVVGDDSADVNTKTFYLSGASDLTNAQAAYDWYLAGKNPIIIYGDEVYNLSTAYSGNIVFLSRRTQRTLSNKETQSYYRNIQFILNSGTVTSISINSTNYDEVLFLSTNTNYSTPYTPLYDGSPATKKYVDDSVSGAVSKGTTAPSSPVEGQLRYDTTNDVLKVYNGTTWVEVGGGITNDTTGTTSTISQEWVGTKAEFEALSSYGDKIYNIIE